MPPDNHSAPAAVPLLARSTRLYRWCLRIYPPRFRQMYGPSMAQVFRDCCRDAWRQSGYAGLLQLYFPTLFELIVTGLRERLEEGIDMAQWVRWSGTLAILGGLLWSWGVLVGASRPLGIPDGPYRDLEGITWVWWVALVGMALGAAGLYTRLRGRGGRLGWVGLALVIGSLVSFPVYSLASRVWDVAWWIAVMGIFALIFATVCLGIAAWQARVLTLSLAWALVLAGLLMLVFNTEDHRIWLGLPFGLAWVAVGYQLWREAPAPGTGGTRLA